MINYTDLINLLMTGVAYTDGDCMLYRVTAPCGVYFHMVCDDTEACHRISACPSITDAARLQAHWEGFTLLNNPRMPDPVKPDSKYVTDGYIRPGTRSKPDVTQVSQAWVSQAPFYSGASHWDDVVLYSGGRSIGVMRGTTPPRYLGYGIQAWSMPEDSPPQHGVWRAHRGTGRGYTWGLLAS